MDGNGRGKVPTPNNNETIDYWMRTPLNLTHLYYDKLPVSPYCTDPSIIEGQPALFFLGHISPIFAPFFLVFSRFSPS